MTIIKESNRKALPRIDSFQSNTKISRELDIDFSSDESLPSLEAIFEVQPKSISCSLSSTANFTSSLPELNSSKKKKTSLNTKYIIFDNC